jgi:hypothetical protein
MGSVAVLHAVASDYVFGFDIIDATGLTRGTVYPALDRLEEQRLLRSTWGDEAAATREKRPDWPSTECSARSRSGLNRERPRLRDRGDVVVLLTGRFLEAAGVLR